MKRSSLEIEHYKNWSILSGACEGLEHQEQNIPLQDAYITGLNGNLLFFAIADGVGSANFSHLGAKLVVAAVKAHLSSVSEVDDQVVREVFKVAAQKLQQLSQSINAQLEDLATTLQVLVFNLEDSKLYYGRVGDGAALILSGAGYQILSPAKTLRGKDMAAPDFLETLYTNEICVTDLRAIVAFTDGLEPFFIEGISKAVNTEQLSEINKLVTYVEKGKLTESMLSVIKLFMSDGGADCRDDKTIVCVANNKKPTHQAFFEAYQNPKSKNTVSTVKKEFPLQQYQTGNRSKVGEEEAVCNRSSERHLSRLGFLNVGLSGLSVIFTILLLLLFLLLDTATTNEPNPTKTIKDGIFEQSPSLRFALPQYNPSCFQYSHDPGEVVPLASCPFVGEYTLGTSAEENVIHTEPDRDPRDEPNP